MNILINKFCNLLMRSGNKTKARALLMESFTLFLRAVTEISTIYSNQQSAPGFVLDTGRLSSTDPVSLRPSLSAQHPDAKRARHARRAKQATPQAEQAHAQHSYLSLLPVKNVRLTGQLKMEKESQRLLSLNRVLAAALEKESKQALTPLREAKKKLKIGETEQRPVMINQRFRETRPASHITSDLIGSYVKHNSVMPNIASNAAWGRESQESGKLFIPENILDTIVENVRPRIEIRKVRVARATYQVPAQINKSKGQTLALRWIIEFAKKAKLSHKISFPEALAEQLKLALEKQGPVRERRSHLHRLGEANRSYMRYRWW